MTDAPEHNPFHMVRLAASGDLKAQRALACEAADFLAAGDLVGFYEGLTYARMAASHGDTEDIGRVLSLLGLASHLLDPSDGDGHSALTGQALAYSMVAQAKTPSPEFGAMVDLAMDTASAAEMQAGKYYYDLLREAEKLRGE